ncbi:endonuclease/exonuclease/phosphatase family protein [Gelidibacter maritimus]|uniref:Endonuclease/exonuclease/phosphatase family protein n=1 Tax=Gelidibacter maritimus TaxID=2761487 RepID=A0A7W2R5A4_9FLAO|nr:endonuclease/exonuclease/phosphatase family protein [Gelidibacter maritimus]MBA6154558.1 endonuclease/exonuclease/phosphatase family protein [Gelidibacter maritimus]
MKKIAFILICFSVFSSCKINEKQTVELKVMSYNIRHGKGLDTILDLSRAADLIKSQAPDICALQEVDHFISRSNNTDQTEFLARETNMEGTFGKFMDFQNGEYGMATLSKKPLISTQVLDLPDGKHEPRTSIVHEVALSEDGNIVFANVHFDWISGTEGSNNRLNQAKALVAKIDSLKKAAIITGDFNCTPDSPTMLYFAEQGFVFVEKGDDNLSFQGENQAEIDHLIYRNSEDVSFKTKNVQLLIEPVISDHRPLIVDLEVLF